ncbi:MAG: HAD-IIIA family hydrolase [Bacteroidota bacterium]
MEAEKLKFDKSWTLFLDRDGVINKKLHGDYVKCISEFEFISGVKEAIKNLSGIFGRLIIITNQQGIGKGAMQITDLEKIHDYLINEIKVSGGAIHGIYFCPDLDGSNSTSRKPATGMAFLAKKEFPEIEFAKTIMVGDSMTDMEFAKKLGMVSVYIRNGKQYDSNNNCLCDYVFNNLKEFSESIQFNNEE